jgi:hypothetical protein
MAPRSLTRYAECVVLEDLTVNGALSGCTPLALSTWRGRTGLDPLPPLFRRGSKRAWSDRVDINLAELRRYAQAVYAATDSYLMGCEPVHDRLTVHVLTALLLSLSPRRVEEPPERIAGLESARERRQACRTRPRRLAVDCETT